MNSLATSPVLASLLSYLFNALWQIPLVFAAAWIASRMLRRAAPRSQHRAWVAALLLQVALPACSFTITDLGITGIRSALLRLFATSGGVGAGSTRVVFGPATALGGTLRLSFVIEAGIVLAWVCCLLYFAGRLAWGLRQTRILARSASRIPLTDDTALRVSQHCRRLGIAAPLPEIALSPHGIGPVTVGLRRGLVLVPSAFLEIPAADLDAVLAHELAHVARRDFAKNLLYGLLSLPVAWHPVLWRTRACVAESRELVCDALAADAIAREEIAGRKQYAQSLLRIASMLARRPPVATLHGLGIFNINRDTRTLERRVMTLTRKPAPMSTARRILVAAALSAVAFATCASALALHTDVAPSSQDAAPNARPSKIHVKSAIMSGQKISGEDPIYPKEAKAKKIQGAVVIDAIIGKDGTIKNLHIVKTPDKSLSDSALKAVRTWRYRPYLLNGEPVVVETTVNVVYNLEG